MSLSDDALEWRRERDRRESLKRDLEPERKAAVKAAAGGFRGLAE
jgi:hypothetical protein